MGPCVWTFQSARVILMRITHSHPHLATRAPQVHSGVFTLSEQCMFFSILVPMTHALSFLREILGVPSSAS